MVSKWRTAAVVEEWQEERKEYAMYTCELLFFLGVFSLVYFWLDMDL